MALTPAEFTALKELDRRTAGGLAVELVDDKQVAFWRSMALRGFARLSSHARCGFDMVPGDYVSITAAGQAVLNCSTSCSA